MMERTASSNITRCPFFFVGRLDLGLDLGSDFDLGLGFRLRFSANSGFVWKKCFDKGV